MKNVLVIMTAYKRDYFKEQIDALKKQEGVNIKKILLWQNENHVNIDYLRDYDVKIFKSDENCKYHGRFALPLLYDEIEYTCIMEDDTIPGSQWIQNAIRCVDTYNCIAGQNGRTYNYSTKSFEGFGDIGRNPTDLKVDLVGHSWVFKTEWVRYLWMQKQVSYQTGEDMQLSLSCLYHANIPTYCVKQTNDNDTGQLKIHYGGDDKATFRLFTQHNELRSQIFEEWYNKIKNKNE